MFDCMQFKNVSRETLKKSNKRLFFELYIQFNILFKLY